MVPARPRQDEQANLHTMEAVIVIMMMASAVIFVATFDSPPQGSAPSRAILQQQAQDALSILYDTPLKDDPDRNAMSEYLLECLQGDCSDLQRKLDKLLPEGAQYGVYMSNGVSLYTVYETRPPSGESTSARQYFEPAWSHTFLGAAAEYVNPSADGLVVYALPILNSHPLSQGGSPLQVRVEGTRVSDNSTYVLTSSYTTRAHDASAVTQAYAASLTFVDASDAPMAAMDARAITLTGLSPSLTPMTLRLRLEETAGVPIPAGTKLTVHIPAGWTASADPAANPSWTVLANATDKNASYLGADVEAQLLTSISGTSVDFTFEGVYRGDVVDHYPFTATLSSGAGSHAALLVRADAHGTQPALETPQILMSVPKPMGALAQTTWTLAAMVPEGTSAFGSDAVDVTRVEILEEDGAAIFGSITALNAEGGTWTNEGDRLVWTGSKSISHGDPLNLTFQVTASGTAGNGDTRAAFVTPITFDSWTGRITQRTAPGLFRGTFLPATASQSGYNSSTGAWIWNNHTYATEGTYRDTTPLPGNGSYHAGAFSLLRDSVYGSSITFDSRKVAIGADASLAIDVQSTLYALAELGASPTVTLRIHPPWADDTSSPISTKVLFNASELGSPLLDVIDITGDGRPEPSTYGHYNTTSRISETWLFGTYVTEVKLDWTETTTGVVGGTPVSESIVRSASIYDYFVVTPPDGLSPPSPIYDVHLVVWLDDWR